jgi:hypothetical protein
MAILKAFPGARIEAVRDSALDDYGLAAMANLGGESELSLDLPPPGTDDFDEPADFWENAP